MNVATIKDELKKFDIDGEVISSSEVESLYLFGRNHMIIVFNSQEDMTLYKLLGSCKQDENTIMHVGYKKLNEITEQLLDCCKKYRIKKVCIGVSHESVQESVTFTFGPKYSIFTNEARHGSWPAIWRVCEELQIGWGAGNTNQHQLKSDCGLRIGCYHYENDSWVKVS